MFKRPCIHKAGSKKPFYSGDPQRVLNKAALRECGRKNKDVKKGSTFNARSSSLQCCFAHFIVFTLLCREICLKERKGVIS